MLRRYAPTWVAQLPVLSSDGRSLQREILGATPERMLREIAEALETLTADVTLILFLDDLHWADEATIDFVNLVARRSEPSRLLLVGTYRPADLALGPPALKVVRQDLARPRPVSGCRARPAHPQRCRGLSRGAIRPPAFPDGFARFLHGRTDGNPLFLTNLLGHLVRDRTLDEVDGRWTARAHPRAHRRRRARFAPPVGGCDGRPPWRQRAAHARSGQRQRHRIYRRCGRGGARGRAGQGRRVARYPGVASAVCPQQRRRPTAGRHPVRPLRFHARAFSTRALSADGPGRTDAPASESRPARRSGVRGPRR